MAKMSEKKYFFMSENITRNPAGIVLLNEGNLALPGMIIFGLPDMRVRGIPIVTETPTFKHVKRDGPYPRDIERFGNFWVISKKLKKIFEDFDPEAFDFLECKVWSGDIMTTGEHWFCDVVRVLDVIDESKSKLESAFIGGKKYYHLSESKKIHLNRNIIKKHRVFMVDHCWPNVMCDEELVKICKSEKIKNISFEKAEK